MLSWNKKQNKTKQNKKKIKSGNQPLAGKVKLFIYCGRACDTLVIRMDHILVSNSAN